MNDHNAFTAFFFPDLTISNENFYEKWMVRKREIFSRYVKRNFLIFGIIAGLHPFLIEIPAKAQNLSYFIAARWFVAILLFTFAALEKAHLLDFRRYTFVFSIVILIPSYLQGLCMSWDPRLPWVFSVIVPLLFSSILFASFSTITVHYILGTLIQIPFLREYLQESNIQTFISLWLLGFVLITLFGIIYSGEVDKFQAAQRYIALSERTLEQLRNELKLKGIIATFASQIAHDIRSPLELLSTIQKSEALPKDLRETLPLIVSRLRGIVDQLLTNNRQLRDNHPDTGNTSFAPSHEAVINTKIAKLLGDAIDEKRRTIKSDGLVSFDIAISEGTQNVYAWVQPVEFGRLLSNILNNSIEASEGKGNITVEMRIDENWVVVEIGDSGKGMPSTVLTQLGQPGISFGKPNGNGLGVHHAKKTVEHWGGIFDIRSNEGQGTEVVMMLPREKR